MHDFAKYDRLVTEPGPTPRQWKPDMIGTMFGLVLGAITILAILNKDEKLEIERDRDVVAEDISETVAGPQFEFYKMLKRDDLYPALRG